MLRVSPGIEREGLDKHEHGGTAVTMDGRFEIEHSRSAEKTTKIGKVKNMFKEKGDEFSPKPSNNFGTGVANDVGNIELQNSEKKKLMRQESDDSGVTIKYKTANNQNAGTADTNTPTIN